MNIRQRGKKYKVTTDREHKQPVCMSRKSDCWDNAVAESFFASWRKERRQWRHYQTRAEEQRGILNYIVIFYYSRQLHSTLDYTSSNDYESTIIELKKAAQLGCHKMLDHPSSAPSRAWFLQPILTTGKGQ